MSEKAVMTQMLAGALAENLKGTTEGAAEYDRLQAVKLQEENRAVIPEKDNWPADLYRAFCELDMECIRQATYEIPLLKRIAADFPELKNMAEELIAHTQTQLEIYLRQAEYDSERLAEFTAV